MNFKAQSDFRPADLSRLMQSMIPRIAAAVTEGCEAVVTEAQSIVPIDTGELSASIHTASVQLVGSVVSGTVVADAPHAAFVEYGTGLTGEGTYPYDLPAEGVPYTGGWVYDYKDQNWQGHPAQPFMRPAVDNARPAIVDAFAKQGFKA